MFGNRGARCSGIIIVHLDGSTTCTDADCQVAGIIERAMRDHSSFVPCRAVFETCPLCNPAAAITSDALGGAGAEAS